MSGDWTAKVVLTCEGGRGADWGGGIGRVAVVCVVWRVDLEGEKC